jgi:hypothetical protein
MGLEEKACGRNFTLTLKEADTSLSLAVATEVVDRKLAADEGKLLSKAATLTVS